MGSTRGASAVALLGVHLGASTAAHSRCGTGRRPVAATPGPATAPLVECGEAARELSRRPGELGIQAPSLATFLNSARTCVFNG